MKKFIIAAGIVLSLFAVSYGIASAVNNSHVVAKADCDLSTGCKE